MKGDEVQGNLRGSSNPGSGVARSSFVTAFDVIGDVLLRFLRAEWSAPLVSLVFLVACFSLISEAFRRPENFYNIGLQAPIIAIIAVGQTLIITAGGIDLSVGSVLAFASVNAAWLLNKGYSPHLGLLVAILTGCFCGLINGSLVVLGRLPPFIATLGMMGIARGLAHLISGGVSIYIPRSWFWGISSQKILFMPMPFLIAILVALCGHITLAYTRFGRHLYAVGGSYEAARLSGVPVRRVLMMAFVLCGLCTGIASVVEASRVTVGSPMSGIMYELHAIAACVIGGASLSGGRGTIIGTIAGALLMAVLRNGCDALNLRYEYQQIVIGIAVIVAVLYDRWRHERTR